MLSRALAAFALSCALAACAQRGDDGSAAAPASAASAPASAGSVPASAYESALHAKQAQLAEQDRASAARRRADVARVVTGTARDVTPASSMVERFVVRVANHGVRAIRRIDGGVIVYGGAGLHRLGLASFSASADVPPGRSADVRVAIPLTAFAAEGAGALARASGTPKRVELELTGYSVEKGAASSEPD
ncbi:MAG: hypothetical protein JWM87_2544 [Candidatus Eremiobacteraeota bacterium]|nr:hypothetical protein [Candidatus Eremiobacteraeota bacterium]